MKTPHPYLPCCACVYECVRLCLSCSVGGLKLSVGARRRGQQFIKNIDAELLLCASLDFGGSQ